MAHVTQISDSSHADLALMRRVASRDAAAQNVLLTRIVRRVQRLCRLVLRNAADADDASQQALIEVLNSARTFRAPGNLEAWTDRIAARTALRVRGQRTRRSTIAQSVRAMADSWFESATPPARSPRELEEYLNELSDARRDAFVLKHALGYTVEEIGRITNTPPGTVKDRLVAARKQLRRHFAEDAKWEGQA